MCDPLGMAHVYVTCPVCKGTGGGTVEFEMGKPVKADCDRCGGTGKVQQRSDSPPPAKHVFEVWTGNAWSPLEASVVGNDKNVISIVFDDALARPADFDGRRFRMNGVEAASAAGKSKAGNSITVVLTMPVRRFGG